VEQCEQNIQLKWMAEATSSIYATPLITDLYADGFKDLIVPSFLHNVEVFQGDNGAQAAGFPAFHNDKVHASPLMYDIDHDGIADIMIATYNGEILFYEDNGNLMTFKLAVSRLTVKRSVLGPKQLALALCHPTHASVVCWGIPCIDKGNWWMCCGSKLLASRY
jgi:hypothetical protein